MYVQGLKWNVKNGASINFWNDFWLSSGSVRSLIQGPLSREEEQLTVQQSFEPNGEWNPRKISFELLHQISNTIRATSLSYNLNAKDSLIWAFSKDGLFSHKSAYLLAKGLNPLNPNTLSLDWFWKIETLPRIQFFIWLCFHNSVPTGEVLGSRGLSLNPICFLCLHNNESIDHLGVVRLHNPFGIT